jgi:sigma-B regulation protein RsbU (phosphoserine phosphatase)
MDGLTLLSKLVDANRPVLKTVIVSAYGDMENIRTAMNRGAFDFLTKPIDFEDLETVIGKTLQELRAMQQALQTREQLLKLQQELNVARTIQQSILPQTFPPFPDKNEFELFAEMIAARQVGGDFFDFFLIGENRLGFVIGDVSGKGVPAALFMAVSRTLLKATASKGLPAAECLDQVNCMLCSESKSGLFVTIFYGILDFHSGELEYCNGGHNPPYLIRGENIEALEMTDGLVLGLFDPVRFSSNKVVLQSGDTLVLFTDGITEAADASETMYSDQRLQNVLQRRRSVPLPEMVEAIVSEVRDFTAGAPQSDDITVLALRYLGV